MAYRAERIHRAEYDPSKAPRSKVQRCQILLKTPTIFRNAVRKATPTPAEACEFEKINFESYSGPRHVAEKKGWDILGCGIHRCGIKVRPGLILKLAFPSDEARGANQYEVATYNIAEDRVKDVFTPVVAHSPTFKWVVVPEARTEKNDGLSRDRLESIRGEVEDYLRGIGAQCTDLHLGNIGLLDNKPVIIDFGFGVVCKRREVTREKPPARRLSEFKPISPVQAPPEEISRSAAQVAMESAIGLGEPVPETFGAHSLISGLIHENAENFRKLPDSKRTSTLWSKMVAGNQRARNLMNNNKMTSAYAEALDVKKLLLNAKRTKPARVRLVKPKPLFPKKKVPCNFDWECVQGQLCHNGFCKKPARVKAKVPKKAAREGALTRRYRLLMEQAQSYRKENKIAKAAFLERAAEYFKAPKYERPIPSSVDLSEVISLLSPTRQSQF